MPELAMDLIAVVFAMIYPGMICARPTTRPDPVQHGGSHP